MPKAGSRGGAQTAKSALEADYLSVSLGNPEMIKRLKVLDATPGGSPSQPPPCVHGSDMGSGRDG